MYSFPEDLKTAYEGSPLSFVYYQNIDDQPVPILASDGFCRNTGMPRKNVLEWLRFGMFERMHPDDVGVVSKISDDFLHHRAAYDVVFRCRLDPASPQPFAKAGKPHYVQIHGVGKWQTMPDGTELAVIGYTNLSATQQVFRKTMEMYSLLHRDRFYTDPLTGVPNINYMHEFGNDRINILRAEGKTPYLVLTDLNSMQSYNYQYGVKEGDRLLCLTAETLKQEFPQALVTRGADDHFVLIVCADDAAALERELYQVNDVIRRSASGNTTGFRCGVCPVGPGVTLTAALDHAKHALKQIENDMNRGVAFFSQQADDVYWRNRYIVENFDRAMENGWIRVFYHALYRIETQKITALEGLARWVDPERGIISPSEFIPVLRKYHQLYKLDLYMFEQVCREVKARHDSGMPLLPVSVNFSRQDFDHADIAEEMNRLYEQYDLAKYVDKSYFIVEITEQDLAAEPEKLHKQLKRICDSGYRLWLDDFGSGYSAINVIGRFEFDLIKLDMDLLRHLDDHGDANRLILKELVYVARKLGVHTLIEGLETSDHLSFVREIGCELAQGYYYHKPEPLEEIMQKTRCADLAALCETPQERDAMNRKWFR